MMFIILLFIVLPPPQGLGQAHQHPPSPRHLWLWCLVEHMHLLAVTMTTQSHGYTQLSYGGDNYLGYEKLKMILDCSACCLFISLFHTSRFNYLKAAGEKFTAWGGRKKKGLGCFLPDDKRGIVFPLCSRECWACLSLEIELVPWNVLRLLE